MSQILEEGKPGDHQENPSSSSPKLEGVVMLFAVAGILALVVTWFLDTYFPIPDEDTFYFCLIGSLFVLFLTLPLTAWMILKARAPIKESLGVLLLGLFSAGAMGSFPFLRPRLIDAMPWTLEFPWLPLLTLGMFAWGLWARWKQKNYMGSRRGKLIFTVFLLFTSAFYALVSVSKFSAGNAWLGAAYLVIALGFGLVILLDRLISRQRRGALPENVG